MEKITVTISFRLSLEERLELEALAEERGEKLSVLMRNLVHLGKEQIEKGEEVGDDEKQRQ